MTDAENNNKNKLKKSDKINNILSYMNQEEIVELVCEGIDNLIKSGYLENLLNSESFKSLLKSDELKKLSDKLKKLVESNKDSKYGFSQPEENNINAENIAVNLFHNIAGIAMALLVAFLLSYNKNDD